MGAYMHAPPQRTPARVLAGTLASVAVIVALAPITPSRAAEGGPSLNIPVPASARPQTGGATATPGGGTTTPGGGTTTTPASPAAGAGQAIAPAGTTATTTPPAVTVPAQTAPGAAGAAGVPVKRTSEVSGAALALAVLAALLALLALAWAIVRTRAVEPRWTLSLRHAMAEAGYRASATWAELGDWLRLGR
jgi:hypothetical protein